VGECRRFIEEYLMWDGMGIANNSRIGTRSGSSRGGLQNENERY